ncbi:MAG: NfeD family protein [Bacteroidales bacterium]|nr:NfeD family protein [Bacteroidales bacterium]
MSPVTIWLLCGVLGIGLELIVPGLIVIFFGCGAVLTGLCLWLFPAMAIELQLIIFAVVSVILLFAFRKMLKKKFFQKATTDKDELADEYVGKQAVALTEFENGRGKVEFKGTGWEATSSDEIHKGDLVLIVSHESITLQIQKL